MYSLDTDDKFGDRKFNGDFLTSANDVNQIATNFS